MRVAVGTEEGQPQGFWTVVWKVQSEKAQDLLQPRFWMVRVAVGQTGAPFCWERARLARPRRVVRASFMVEAAVLLSVFDTMESGGGGNRTWKSRKL